MSYYPNQPQQIVVVQAKSNLIAYLLWFFLGGFGIHKLYLRQGLQFALYLGLQGLAGLFWLIGMGWLFHIPLAILLIIDIFTIPSRVRKINRHG